MSYLLERASLAGHTRAMSVAGVFVFVFVLGLAIAALAWSMLQQRRLEERLKRQQRSLDRSVEEFRAAAAEQIEALGNEHVELRRLYEFHKRRGDELFGVIEQMEVQRDEWRHLYREQCATGHGGQALLENGMIALRMLVASLVRECNGHRAKYNAERDPSTQPLPEIKPPFTGLLDEPVGLSLTYHERYEQLARAREEGLEKEPKFRLGMGYGRSRIGGPIKIEEGEQPPVEKWSGPHVDGMKLRAEIMGRQP